MQTAGVVTKTLQRAGRLNSFSKAQMLRLLAVSKSAGNDVEVGEATSRDREALENGFPPAGASADRAAALPEEHAH